MLDSASIDIVSSGITVSTGSVSEPAEKNVDKSTRIRFYIDYPIVKPHFIRSDRYQVGIEEAEIDGKPVKIYDRERTICDLLLHRNKVDGEVFNVAIQRYVQDPKKVEARLMKYAKLLHVEKK